jgi:hypothetical protein
VEVDGSGLSEEWGPGTQDYYDHDYLRRPLELDPGATGELRLDYRVPGAASVDDSGVLTYRLAVDPQALVRPQGLRVKVRLPEGYRAVDLPDGWAAEGTTLTYRAEDVAVSQDWEIRAEPAS